MNTPETAGEHDEFITIIGSDFAAITQEFHAQGLAERDYSIVHRIGRHRFTKVNGERSEVMFAGEPLIAATYQRRRTA